MKLNELIENYGNYEVKEGFLNFLQKPKPKTVYDLQKGDKYWFIWTNGNIGCECWEGAGIDIARRENGNCYLTEGEAVFALEKKKIIAEMKRLGGTENMMSLGNEDTIKYFIRYRHGDKLLYIDRCNHIQAINIYFATYEQAQKAIDEIGEDRIKKYLFYVED